MADVGNFKGVMLCNRPAQIPGSLQAVTGPTPTSGISRPAFVSTVANPSIAGLPPVRSSRPPIRRRPKPAAHSVTTRHKKWLHAYELERSSVEEQKQYEKQQQHKSEQKLREKSQRMRDEIRQITRRGGGSGSDEEGEEEGGDEEEKIQELSAALARVPGNQSMRNLPSDSVAALTATINTTRSPTHAQPTSAPLRSSSSASGSGGSSTSRLRLGSLKPGWARTETEQAAHIDAEADELLDFASQLDYNSYIHDVEVREALRFVQERVDNLASEKEKEAIEEERKRKEIEKQRLVEEAKEAEEWEEVMEPDENGAVDEHGQIVMKKIRRRRFKVQSENPFAANNGAAGGQLEGGEGEAGGGSYENALSTLSREVLESNRNLRNIHSSASVRAMMEAEEKVQQLNQTTTGKANGTSRIGSGVAAGGGEEGQMGKQQDLSVPPPLISVTHQKATLPSSTASKSVDPSNLPFLHRHPAV